MWLYRRRCLRDNGRRRWLPHFSDVRLRNWSVHIHHGGHEYPPGRLYYVLLLCLPVRHLRICVLYHCHGDTARLSGRRADRRSGDQDGDGCGHPRILRRYDPGWFREPVLCTAQEAG